MIIPLYRIGPSRIPGAGKGLFVDELVMRGRVVVAPDKVHTLLPERDLRKHPAGSIEVESSVRWFEDWFSLTPEWSDECYINHSFMPNGLWHLGFIFAQDDLVPGTELTIDYRLVIGSGEEMPFRDAVTGEKIVGLPWRDNLRQSAQRLLDLI
ncbi:MAG: SET domain-containing protein [Nevskia sp.]|nr:SET domain-containing protein [Nevskia sp.]